MRQWPGRRAMIFCGTLLAGWLVNPRGNPNADFFCGTTAAKTLVTIAADEAGYEYLRGEWTSCKIHCSTGECHAEFSEPHVRLTFGRHRSLTITEGRPTPTNAVPAALGTYRVTTVEALHWRQRLKRIAFDATFASTDGTSPFSANVGNITDNGYHNLYLSGLHANHDYYCRPQ